MLTKIPLGPFCNNFFAYTKSKSALPAGNDACSTLHEITHCISRQDLDLHRFHFTNDAAFKKESLTTFRYVW